MRGRGEEGGEGFSVKFHHIMSIQMSLYLEDLMILFASRIADLSTRQGQFKGLGF